MHPERSFPFGVSNRREAAHYDRSEALDSIGTVREYRQKKIFLPLQFCKGYLDKIDRI